jgi:sulfotransferase
MMQKTFHFLSGLPRSGSTVLAALLNQHPQVYVTPTSPMLDLLVENQDTWHKLPSVKANPIPEQLTDVTRAMIGAMWAHRPEPIIIDKNRGWGKNMPASTILFQRDIKMIATTRDLPSIMASWLTLLRKNPDSYMDQTLAKRGLAVNDENRMGEMWFNMVQDCMESLQQAKQDAANRLLLVDYDRLVTDPQAVLEEIGSFLALPAYQYNIDDIKSGTADDDLLAWGLAGMHSIRSKLAKTSGDPREILGSSLYDRFIELERQYQ